MPLQVYYRDNDGTLVGPVTALELDRIRQFVYETSEHAEEGSVGNSRIAMDDPQGNLDIPGLRLIGVKESAASNATQPFLFAGYTTDRNVLRGHPSHRTTVSRLWDVGVVDANTILEARVMVGADCNRPAETDVARITWLLSTAESILIQDERYFSSADPEPMDAVDYRGQSFKSIIDDCAQQSGKNYFITYFADTATANLPWGVFSLWYGHASSTAYSSTIALSNVLEDVDGVTTFAISQENTTLNRDPSRVYSGMYVPYDGGNAYVQLASTVNNFMQRDGTSPAQNVKTAAKANRRGNRMLADIATEEDVVHTEFIVPAAQVNDLRPGMRVPFRASHLPGYEAPQYMRVLNRTVSQTQEQRYTIKVDLSGPLGSAVESSILVAFINMGGPGSLAEPTDNSVHPWTKAFWTGNYASVSPIQNPGPGGAGSFGMWYRAVVPGETGASVITVAGQASQALSIWVKQITGPVISGVQVTSGHDTYIDPPSPTVSSPSAAVDSIFIGGYMFQKVNYGQFTVMTTNLGTELINTNGYNQTGVCTDGDGNPPKAFGAYRTGTGVLTIGQTLVCTGATPNYNCFGRGYGGILFPLSGEAALIQEGFGYAVGANVAVSLPAAP